MLKRTRYFDGWQAPYLPGTHSRAQMRAEIGRWLAENAGTMPGLGVVQMCEEGDGPDLMLPVQRHSMTCAMFFLLDEGRMSRERRRAFRRLHQHTCDSVVLFIVSTPATIKAALLDLCGYGLQVASPTRH